MFMEVSESVNTHGGAALSSSPMARSMAYSSQEVVLNIGIANSGVSMYD